MDQEVIVQFYKDMQRIRNFEKEALSVFKNEHIACNFNTHKYNEAILVGALSVLEADDFVLSSISPYAVFPARGGALPELFAEMLAQPAGPCGGKAGLLNIFDSEHRFIGGWSIPAMSLSVAAGFAYAQRHHGVPNVTLCFVSDSDLANGSIYETIEIAEKWNLPLVTIIQSQHQNFSEYKDCQPSFALNLKDINYDNIDGLDIFAVRSAVHTAITVARENHAISIIEAHTVTDNAADNSQCDPLLILENKLNGFGKQNAVAKVKEEIENEISHAKRFIQSALHNPQTANGGAL